MFDRGAGIPRTSWRGHGTFFVPTPLCRRPRAVKCKGRASWRGTGATRTHAQPRLGRAWGGWRGPTPLRVTSTVAPASCWWGSHHPISLCSIWLRLESLNPVSRMAKFTSRLAVGVGAGSIRIFLRPAGAVCGVCRGLTVSDFLSGVGSMFLSIACVPPGTLGGFAVLVSRASKTKKPASIVEASCSVLSRRSSR